MFDRDPEYSLIIDNSSRIEPEKLAQALVTSKTVKNIGEAIEFLKSCQSRCDRIFWHLRDETLLPYENIEKAFSSMYTFVNGAPRIFGVSDNDEWCRMAKEAIVVFGDGKQKCFDGVFSWTRIREWLRKWE